METPTLPITLNMRQKAQIIYQWQTQQRTTTFEGDIEICAGGLEFTRFVVRPGVLRPDITDSMMLARFLFYNNARYYARRRVLDMGCGSGLIGLVLAKAGADEVHLCDIQEACVENSRENGARFCETERIMIYQSDLFASVHTHFGVIVFSHPFFAAEMGGNDPILKSMIAPAGLLRRFLENARTYLDRGGIILTCYFDVAGDENDPVVQGKKAGYRVREVFRFQGDLGAVDGTFSIFELR